MDLVLEMRMLAVAEQLQTPDAAASETGKYGSWGGRSRKGASGVVMLVPPTYTEATDSNGRSLPLQSRSEGTAATEEVVLGLTVGLSARINYVDYC